MKKSRKAFRVLIILTIATVLFIWCRSMQNADQSTGESGFFLTLLQPVLNILLPGTADEQMHFVRKLAHFTEYAVLGAETAGLYCLSGVRMPHCLTGAAFFPLLTAVIDEAIQLNVPGRSGSPADVLIDFSGAVTGLAVLFLLSFLRRKIRNRS